VLTNPQNLLLQLNHPYVSPPITPSSLFSNAFPSPYNFIMSAPNAGRQSPEPEKQTEAQSGQTSSNVNDQGGADSFEGDAKEASKDTKEGLSSNPEHPLAKHAEDTTSKTT
jgi:hypothetical protein